MKDKAFWNQVQKNKEIVATWPDWMKEAGKRLGDPYQTCEGDE